ncbi:hypothetical protein [Amphibiibacter pelophylacis]|uniref:Uncharacterized protein n=1 Tax=Amphibiibacter pelophylacis TaxID=1799477 RepID=A0ACC6P3Q6_9BURK
MPHPAPHPAPAPAARCQHGLGLTELLVSQALGLLLGAMMLGLLGHLALQHAENAALSAAQRHFQGVTQRLVRELRRAGHRRSPGDWVWVDTSRNRATWVYESVSPRPAGTTGPQSAEASGVRISSGVLQTQLGLNNWQAISDPALLWVEALDVAPVGPAIAGICPASGALASVQARPVVRGRRGELWTWRSRIAWPAQPGVRRDAVVLCPPQTGEAP